MAENIPNLHKSMTDSQLHVPKGFAGALTDTHVEKSLAGTSDGRDVRWYANFWNRPVLKFVDGALPPPTEADLDRYVLLQLSATTVDAGWDGAGFNDIVQLDATISGGLGDWESSPPLKGFGLYDCDTNTTQYFNGADWFDLTGAKFEGIRNGETTYNTVNDAVSAVGSGETIDVSEGVYGEGDLFAGAGVSDFNMNFDVGAIVNAPAALEAVFDTSSLPGPADINIIGYGEFNKATDAGFRGIVYANNNADVLSVEVLDMDSNGNTTVWVEDAAGTAEVTVKVRNKANSDGGGVFYSASGILNIEAFKAVESTGGDVVLTDNVQSEINAVFNSVDGGFTGDGGTQLISFQKAINNYVSASAGTVSINGIKAELKTGTALEMIANTGAALRYNVEKSEMDIASGVAALHHTSGTTELISHIINQRNLATANGVKVSGPGLILQHSRVEATHVDAVGISAISAQNVTSRFTSYNRKIDTDITLLQSISIRDTLYDTIAEAVGDVASKETVNIPGIAFAVGDLFAGSNVSDFNMHFEPGSEINAPASSKAVFDGTSCPGGTFGGNISGEGVFNKASDASFKGIFYNNNGADNILFEFRKINANGNTAIWSDAGFILFRAQDEIISAGGTSVYSGGGEILGYVPDIRETNAPTIWGDAANAKITIYARKLETATGQNLRSANGAEVTVYADEAENTTLDANALSRVQDANSILNLHITKITGKHSSALIEIDDGILNLFDCDQAENLDTGANNGILNGGGTINVYRSNVIANGTFSVHANQPGAVRTKYFNSTVKHNGNTTSSHGIELDGGTAIIDDVTIETTNASADSITAGTAKNAKIYLMKANKAKNANVTNIITGGIEIVDADVEV